MAEWLVEEGIAEKRALLVEGDRGLAAKVYWPGELRAGQKVSARLASKPGGQSRGIAIAENGAEILVDRLPAQATEGQTLTVLVTRAPIAERGRLKRAQGRLWQEGETPLPVRDDPFMIGNIVRRFPQALWEDVWSAASAGEVEFDGGSLIFSTTPAMTLIDIDGDGAPRELALAAIPAMARCLAQFDLGGSIGVDFPTITSRSDRKAVDTALEEALSGWPHERTAMNGFGFVQIVARLEGPSLLQRFASARVGAAARMALRRAEMLDGPGVTLLTVHPALKAKLKPEWLAELEKRTARAVRVETDPGLAIEAAQAQIVSHE